MQVLKQGDAFQAVRLEPKEPFDPIPQELGTIADLAACYNRIGGAIEAAAEGLAADPRAALVLWFSEAGTQAPLPGRPRLHVDVSRVKAIWGRWNPEEFAQHFRLERGKAADEGHLAAEFWRPDPDAPWLSAHVGMQAREYAMFDLVSEVAGKESACLVATIGNPPIRGADFEALGYESASALFDALCQSELWQVCAYFDSLAHEKLVKALREWDWPAYARKRDGGMRPQAFVQSCQEVEHALKELWAYPRSGFDIRERRRDETLYALDASRTEWLNLRSGPGTAPVLAVLHEGWTIRKEGEDPEQADWWRVSAALGATKVEGWVQKDYLLPATDDGEAFPVRKPLPAAHLSRQAHVRTSALGRCYPLNEEIMVFRDGTDAETRRSQLLEIARYLDPSNPDHLRYRSGVGESHAETYAYDFCCLARVYLTRVWWSGRSLLLLGEGGLPHVVNGNSVRELSVNTQFDWLAEFGPDYGWQRRCSVDALQEAANGGEVALIVAQHRNQNEAGHIAIVLPEDGDLVAVREEGRVVLPLLSHAGKSPVLARVAKKDWWQADRYRDFAYWTHA